MITWQECSAENSSLQLVSALELKGSLQLWNSWKRTGTRYCSPSFQLALVHFLKCSKILLLVTLKFISIFKMGWLFPLFYAIPWKPVPSQIVLHFSKKKVCRKIRLFDPMFQYAVISSSFFYSSPTFTTKNICHGFSLQRQSELSAKSKKVSSRSPIFWWLISYWKRYVVFQHVLSFSLCIRILWKLMNQFC